MWKTKVGLRGLFIFYMIVSLGVSLVCAVFGGKIEIDSLTRYYYPTRYQLEEQLKQYVSQLQKHPVTKWNSLLTSYAAQSQSNLFIMNDQSHILAYSANFQEPPRKFADYISLSAKNNEEPSDYPVKRTFYAFLPMTYQGEQFFLFRQIKLAGNPTTYDKGNPILTILFGIIGFLVSYLLLTNKKLKQLKEITHGLDKIAHGNLAISLPKRSKDEIGSIASHVNLMASKLKASIDRQKKIEQERMELTTNLSHDVRTPLTSVIGYLRYLSEQKQLPSDQRENYIQIALSKAELLKRLTDQLFLFNKLMYHEAPFQPEMHVLQHLLYQQIEEEMFLLAQEGLETEINFIDEPIKIEIDPVLFVRLIDNLMQNVVRYALKPSTVLISLEQQEQMAVLKISNAAKNIDEATFSRLFDTFVTGDSSRPTGGNGLGLAIVKRIVELHDGNIVVTQENNQITFRMYFPITKYADSK